MVNFKNKLFVLAGVSTMFAGMAFGQAVATCNTASANANFVRAEGKTEQVADTTIQCNSNGTAIVAGQTASITVYLSPSVNITSGSFGTPAVNETEAGVSGVAANTTAFTVGSFVNGTVSGNSVTFSNISLPAVAANTAFFLTITNIKIDASSLATSNGAPTGVTETIFMSGSAIVPNVISPVPTVAYATNGLSSVKALDPTNTPGTAIPTIFICGGIAAGAPSFNIDLSEGFANAFKVKGTSGANATLGSEFTSHTETGFGTANSNTATSGTRVKIVFNNIPANVKVYVPSTVSGNGATLTLTKTETGAFAAATVIAPGAGLPPVNSGLLTVSSGSATAVYETTTAATSGPAALTVPVYLVASAGFAQTVSGNITATVSLAPVGSATSVPNFVSGSSTTTVTGVGFGACTTTLLFPYVTAGNGFDTGIAITNTSNDLLATTNGTPSTSAANQSGTCQLTFFGTNAPASTIPATSTVASGASYATLLSAVAPGFTGYTIASCNFLYAHGFAYIVYNFGQTNGTTMGYLADAINSTRTASTAAPEITQQ